MAHASAAFAGLRRHPKALSFLNQCRPTARSSSRPRPRSTRSTARGAAELLGDEHGRSSTSASATSGTRGTSPARSSSRAGTSSPASSRRLPDKSAAARRLLRRRRPLGVRGEDARGAGLRGRRQPRGRLHRLEAERLPDAAADRPLPTSSAAATAATC